MLFEESHSRFQNHKLPKTIDIATVSAETEVVHAWVVSINGWVGLGWVGSAWVEIFNLQWVGLSRVAVALRGTKKMI